MRLSTQGDWVKELELSLEKWNAAQQSGDVIRIVSLKASGHSLFVGEKEKQRKALHILTDHVILLGFQFFWIEFFLVCEDEWRPEVAGHYGSGQHETASTRNHHLQVRTDLGYPE